MPVCCRWPWCSASTRSRTTFYIPTSRWRSFRSLATPRAGVEVRLENLQRRYGAVTALNDFSLTLAAGELVALLGPSGCGKTTALRLLAGLEEADGGRVVIGGQDVTGLPANKRDVGMVFQSYSLFPHMVAWENVAFGLQMRKVGPADRKRR